MPKKKSNSTMAVKKRPQQPKSSEPLSSVHPSISSPNSPSSSAAPDYYTSPHVSPPPLSASQTQRQWRNLLIRLLILNAKPKEFFYNYIINIALFAILFGYLGIICAMILHFNYQEKFGPPFFDFGTFDIVFHIFMFRIGPCTLVSLVWGLIWTTFTDRLEAYLAGTVTPESFILYLPKALLSCTFTFGLTTMLPLLWNLTIRSIHLWVIGLVRGWTNWKI